MSKDVKDFVLEIVKNNLKTVIVTLIACIATAVGIAVNLYPKVQAQEEINRRQDAQIELLLNVTSNVNVQTQMLILWGIPADQRPMLKQQAVQKIQEEAPLLDINNI